MPPRSWGGEVLDPEGGGHTAPVWVGVFCWVPEMVTQFMTKKLKFVDVDDKRYT